ncbi:MAG: protein kinase [Bacteroidota bacterium]|nr:protein kinase [Candidatus Kapabacteria bacterium]MDW8219396.1 protein kinase [Bacteroidota bacterium]
MPEKIEQYSVGDRIGIGGTGIVRKGRNTETKADVAVKSLSAELVRDALVRKRLREAKTTLTALPRNDAIIHVLDVIESGDTIHIIMEYVPWRSLDALLNRKARPMPYEQATHIIQQVLRGVIASHSKGVLHGSLKPSDILMSSDSALRVGGFGIAPLLSNTAVVRAAGKTGKIVYMPPEQLRGESLDERSDVYSVGVILYRLLTGKLPFGVSERDSEARLRQAVLHHAVPDIAQVMPELQVPPQLASIVRRALAKDRRERIPTSREFARLLQKVQPETQSAAPISASTVAQGTVAAAAVGDATQRLLAQQDPTKPLQEPSLAPLQTSSPTTQASSEVSENAIPPALPSSTVSSSQAPVQSSSTEQSARKIAPTQSLPSEPPKIFSQPTLAKTPMQLEVERRMQAMKAEQQQREQAARMQAEHERSLSKGHVIRQASAAVPSSSTSNVPASTTGSSVPPVSGLVPPSPEELKARWTSTPSETKPEEDKKRRAVLPWLVVGAVALGGGIYYIALKTGTRDASSPAQREISVEEQERLHDSVARYVEEMAQDSAPRHLEQSQQQADNSQRQPDASTMPSPDSIVHSQDVRAREETLEKPAVEKQAPLISNQTGSSASRNAQSQQQAAKQESLENISKAVQANNAIQKQSKAVSAPQQRATASQSPVRTAVAQSSKQAVVSRSSEKPSMPQSTIDESRAAQRQRNTALERKNSGLQQPIPNRNASSVQPAQQRPLETKSGSLAAMNERSLVEREAARERIRKQYAEHLRRKGGIVSSSSTDSSATEPSQMLSLAPKRAANQLVVSERSEKAKNMRTAEEKLESPDASTVELERAVKSARYNEPLLILRGHLATVRAIAFSPDGKLIASGGDDKTVKIWDAATGTIMRSLRGHASSVTSVFFSPDGKLIISSGKDKTVRVWDSATGEPLQRSVGVSCEGTPAAFSPDGQFLAVADKRNITITKVRR